jgi:hypothetical protein
MHRKRILRKVFQSKFQTLFFFFKKKKKKKGARHTELDLNDTISIPCLPAKISLKELFRLGLLRGKRYKSLKERIFGAARTATLEIRYDETGRWGRIGNVRHEEAASLFKRHDNGLNETEHLSSGLLRVLKHFQIIFN